MKKKTKKMSKVVGKKLKRKIGIPCSWPSARLYCLKVSEWAEWRRRETWKRDSEENMSYLKDEE